MPSRRVRSPPVADRSCPHQRDHPCRLAPARAVLVPTVQIGLVLGPRVEMDHQPESSTWMPRARGYPIRRHERLHLTGGQTPRDCGCVRFAAARLPCSSNGRDNRRDSRGSASLGAPLRAGADRVRPARGRSFQDGPSGPSGDGICKHVVRLHRGKQGPTKPTPEFHAVPVNRVWNRTDGRAHLTSPSKGWSRKEQSAWPTPWASGPIAGARRQEAEGRPCESASVLMNRESPELASRRNVKPSPAPACGRPGAPGMPDDDGRQHEPARS